MRFSSIFAGDDVETTLLPAPPPELFFADPPLRGKRCRGAVACSTRGLGQFWKLPVPDQHEVMATAWSTTHRTTYVAHRPQTRPGRRPRPVPPPGAPFTATSVSREHYTGQEGAVRRRKIPPRHSIKLLRAVPERQLTETQEQYVAHRVQPSSPSPPDDTFSRIFEARKRWRRAAARRVGGGGGRGDGASTMGYVIPLPPPERWPHPKVLTRPQADEASVQVSVPG